jgi:hypothetical protein
MSEADGITVYDEDFDRLISQRAAVYGKTIEEEFEYQAGRILHKMIRITPPFAGKMKISAAKRAGEMKIMKNLRGVLVPVDLKGQRRITHVFGHQLKEPVFVPTTEKWTDVERVYRSARRNRFKTTTRGRRRMFYVDRQKFEDLAKKKKKQVGKLGGGYVAAANVLKVAVPGFMKKHKGTAGGSIKILRSSDTLHIVITNAVKYADSVDGLKRRIEWAVQSQKGAMERQLTRAMKQLERNPI